MCRHQAGVVCARGRAAACIKHTHFDLKASAAAAKASHLHTRRLRRRTCRINSNTHFAGGVFSLVVDCYQQTHAHAAAQRRRVERGLGAFPLYIHSHTRSHFSPQHCSSVCVCLSRSILLIALCRNCFFQPMKHFNQHTFRDGLIERHVMCMSRQTAAGCVRAKGG
jgi:hypothetical protein